MLIQNNYGLIWYKITDYKVLTSYNRFLISGPFYSMYFGKFNTQELHMWVHNSNSESGKWSYRKDRNDWYVWFYNALHNPTSTGEKIVSWILNDCAGLDTSQDQMWAYII